MAHAPKRPASPAHPKDRNPGVARRAPIDLGSESVAGEEDPGAALTDEPVADAARKQPSAPRKRKSER
ncbi:MAG: hypothetical protein REI09_00035 [Candidatus Dactylopiibacterium sp.]|nr:hypothetical protein [Candidatus Dactylopiibacterium sp.]